MWGFSIDKIVQETLNRKSKIYSRENLEDSNPYQPKNKEQLGEHELGVSRTPYITMISSKSLLAPDGSSPNDSFSTPVEGMSIDDDVILSNHLNLYYNYLDKKWLSYGQTPESHNYGHIDWGMPGTHGDYAQKDGRTNIPTPGITGLTSEYHTTTYTNFTRKIQVTWKVYSLVDLQLLQERFMNLSRLVYVEWGWKTRFPTETKIPQKVIQPTGEEITEEVSIPTNLLHIKKGEDGSNTMDIDKYRDPGFLRAQVLDRGRGNFDAAIGVIDNFEWNTTENGIECTTNIVTMGVNILDTKFVDAQTGLIPTQTGQQLVELEEIPLPGPVKAPYVAREDPNLLAEQVKDKIHAKGGINPIWTDEYDFNFVINNLHTILEDNYLYLSERTDEQLELIANADPKDKEKLMKEIATKGGYPYPAAMGRPEDFTGRYSVDVTEVPAYRNPEVNWLKTTTLKDTDIIKKIISVKTRSTIHRHSDDELWKERKEENPKLTDEELEKKFDKKTIEKGQYIITTNS